MRFIDDEERGGGSNGFKGYRITVEQGLVDRFLHCIRIEHPRIDEQHLYFVLCSSGFYKTAHSRRKAAFVALATLLTFDYMHFNGFAIVVHKMATCTFRL